MNTFPSIGGHSPWDAIQTIHVLAPGIVQVSTASHGGIWLDPARWAEFEATFPGYKPWAGAPWLEEDCDAAAAALVWPEVFGWPMVRSATKVFAAGDYRPIVKDWLHNSRAGRDIMLKVCLWEKAHAHLWEYSGCSSCNRGWNVYFIRVGDRARREETLLEYPGQQFYTEGELSAVALAKEQPKPVRTVLPVEFNEADCGGVFDGNRVWSETEIGGAPGF